MTSQVEKIEQFTALHRPGDPLILFNIWDVGSAQAVAKAGAKALATGSLSVAGAQGYGDGEKMPLELVIANAARITRATELAVSLDFEGGYGDDPEGFDSALRSVFEAGVVGINIEDQRIGGDGLRPVSEQSTRIAAAAKAGLFVNARTDLFIKAPIDAHDDALVVQALERAASYADAGARSFFVPMLTNAALLGDLCTRSPLPVNVMMKAGMPDHAALAQLGVARISYGPGPWRSVMAWLEDQARATFAHP
jgi:2-methylisocitrate lyase-like PEP mutase family enzyme